MGPSVEQGLCKLQLWLGSMTLIATLEMAGKIMIPILWVGNPLVVGMVLVGGGEQSKLWIRCQRTRHLFH